MDDQVSSISLQNVVGLRVMSDIGEFRELIQESMIKAKAKLWGKCGAFYIEWLKLILDVTKRQTMGTMINIDMI